MKFFISISDPATNTSSNGENLVAFVDYPRLILRRITVLTCNINGVEPSAHDEYRPQPAPVHEVKSLLAAGSAEDLSTRIRS